MHRTIRETLSKHVWRNRTVKVERLRVEVKLANTLPANKKIKAIPEKQVSQLRFVGHRTHSIVTNRLSHGKIHKQAPLHSNSITEPTKRGAAEHTCSPLNPECLV